MTATTKQLLKQAIVGLDRQALDPTILPEPVRTLWQQSATERSTEERFLDAAALTYSYEKTGKQFGQPQDGAHFSELPPLATETRRAPPTQVTQRLVDALRQEDVTALIGALRILGKAGFHVPDALLCELLDIAQNNDELAWVLLDCLSAKAFWLCNLNKAWQGLAIATDQPKVFIEGRAKAKKRFIAWCHPRAPETTVKILTEHWAGHTAKEREAFFDLIAPSLHKADRELLTNCRQDRSERVRRKVLRLLAALGDTDLTEQALVICQQSIQLQGKGRKAALQFTLPESRDERLQALGVLESTDNSELAKPIQWLGQVLELLPPSQVAASLELAPGDFAKQLSKHDIGSDLVSYCDQGARYHNDQDWMEHSIRGVDKKNRISRLCAQLACLDDARLLPLLDELRKPHAKELASAAVITALAYERESIDPALLPFILQVVLQAHHGKRNTPHSLRDALALLLTRLPATAYLDYACLSQVDFKQPPEQIPTETGARFGQLLKLFYDLHQELNSCTLRVPRAT